MPNKKSNFLLMYGACSIVKKNHVASELEAQMLRYIMKNGPLEDSNP